MTPFVPARTPALVCLIGVLRTSLGTLAIHVRMRVPPQHQFLDHKEHAEPGDQREPDAVRAGRSRTGHRFRQQREQRRAEQRSRRETDEMRQDESAVLLTYPQEYDSERRA